MARRGLGLPGRIIGALLIVAGVVGAAWLGWAYLGPGPATNPTNLILPKGASVAQIAHSLKGAGVIGSDQVFELATRFTGAGRTLKAGEYEFRAGASTAQVLEAIRQGRVVRHLISVPEGFTSEMVLDVVRAEPVLTGDATAPPEGSVLPDSYQVQRGQSRAEVIQTMRAAQDALLARLWAGRAPGLPLRTPQEAVTLASIVEKETGTASERPRIAAVFENRLRAHMRLESDPTIIYGISKGRPLGRGITMSELIAATPYNTYKIDGLPPTPIANPGRDSLAAVLNPPQSDELFFVADGTGGHVFASTLEAHRANVAKWRALERARAGAAVR
jgi:UPF0755 protein